MKSKVKPGMRFYQLVTIELLSTVETIQDPRYRHVRRKGRAIWRCVCDCGNDAFAFANQLLASGAKSCGCRLAAEARKTMARLREKERGMSEEEREAYFARMQRTRRLNSAGQTSANSASAATLQSSARRSQPRKKNLAGGIEA